MKRIMNRFIFSDFEIPTSQVVISSRNFRIHKPILRLSSDFPSTSQVGFSYSCMLHDGRQVLSLLEIY